MKTLTRKQAFELSIEKWKLTIENGGKIPDVLPEYITNLRSACGLCEKYVRTINKELGYCAKCPIRPELDKYDDKMDSGCRQNCHPFRIWSIHSTKANAQAVLDLILSKQ